MPTSSAVSSSHNNRGRPRLSPVSENARHNRSHRRRSTDHPVGSSFEVLTPGPGAKSGDDSSRRQDSNAPRHRPDHVSHVSSSSISSTAGQELVFTRKKVIPIKPLKSALSSMLASSGSSTNAFAEMYAAISGRGEPTSTNVQVYFPHAKQPANKAMDLNVRRDATVEEVIGYACYTYWEEGWLPKLDEGLSEDEEDPKRKARLSAVGWILRITEDDGEVDDDFPRACVSWRNTGWVHSNLLFYDIAPDRLGKIAKFNADACAILEANPTQSAYTTTGRFSLQSFIVTFDSPTK